MDQRDPFSDEASWNEDDIDGLIYLLGESDDETSFRALRCLVHIETREVDQQLVQCLLRGRNPWAGDRDRLSSEVFLQQVVKTLQRRESSGIDALITALREPSEPGQLMLIRALGDMRRTEAVAPLSWAVTRAEASLRCEIVGALGKLGPEAVSVLLSLMEDKDDGVRAQVALALGSAHEERVTDSLLGALSDPSGRVRLYATQSLGKLRERRAIPALLALLTGADGSVKHAAAIALGDIGDQQVVEPLLKALSADQSLLHGVVIALGKLGDLRGYETLVSALTHKTEAIRSCAIRSLGQLRDQRAASPLSKLLWEVSAYGSASVDVVKALGQVGGPQAEDALVRFISDKQRFNAWGWIDACEALKVLNTPAPVLLFTELAHPSPYQERAAIGLGLIGDRRAVQPLIEAIIPTGPEPAFYSYEVQREAVKALGILGDKRAVAPLITLLSRDQRIGMRQRTVEALGKLGDLRAVEALIAACKDRVVDIRGAAVEALGHLGDPQALPTLEEIAKRDRRTTSKGNLLEELALEAITRISSL